MRVTAHDLDVTPDQIQVTPSSWIGIIGIKFIPPIEWWRCYSCGNCNAVEWDGKKIEKCLNCNTPRNRSREP